MIAISALLLGTLVASPATHEEISLGCLTAINRALQHVNAEPRASSTARNGKTDDDHDGSDAIEHRYERASCRPSNVLPGRVYIYLTRKGGAFHRDGPYYVVEPSGDVSIRRDMPCEENPSVCE
ncbi:hypothetical protein ACFJIW_04925 [Tahibacter sp. UC22_41]|uniref:hypothetical protein n=1 Tax=Tahibacter sp. UC22_41 TaxID=3350178 RepID=UPI0036D956A1